MIKLKNPRDLIYSAFQVCEVESCKEESEKIWATETRIIDVCSHHYDDIRNSGDIS